MFEQVTSLIEEIGFNIYNRPEGQHATQPEQLAALDVLKRENWRAEKETILMFGRICTIADKRYFMPRSLDALLANWSATLDKARTYKPNEKNLKHNQRNVGVAVGPTDYGQGAKRKLEQQALEAKNRQESEAQGTGS